MPDAQCTGLLPPFPIQCMHTLASSQPWSLVLQSGKCLGQPGAPNQTRTGLCGSGWTGHLGKWADNPWEGLEKIGYITKKKKTALNSKLFRQWWSALWKGGKPLACARKRAWQGFLVVLSVRGLLPGRAEQPALLLVILMLKPSSLPWHWENSGQTFGLPELVTSQPKWQHRLLWGLTVMDVSRYLVVFLRHQNPTWLRFIKRWNGLPVKLTASHFSSMNV